MRIRDLIRSVSIDPARGQSELLRHLASSQGPLIDAIPGTDDVEVTFVCPHDGPSLSLRSPLVSLIPGIDPEHDVALDRVPRTNIWHSSIVVDRRVSTTYQYRLPGETTSGEELETEYGLLRDPIGLAEFAGGMLRRGLADLANPDRLFPVYGVLAGADSSKLPKEQFESVLTLPGAEPFPYLAQDAPAGSTIEFSLPSDESRTVSVYLPTGYHPGRRFPLVVALDGEYYRSIGRLPEILDEAIARGTIPPVVVAFWHNRDASSRLHELTCNSELLAALVDELWPWLNSRFSISEASEHRIIAGFSLGGLAAAWVGLQRPDVFGGVLATSPSLWFAPHPGGEPDAPGWLIREFARRRVRPAVQLSVGTLESGRLDRFGSPLSMIDLSREFASVLQEGPQTSAGYWEVPGGHDYVTVRRATVHGLAELLS